MEGVIKRICELRKKLGISHDAMAAHLNLSQAAYSKIEKGETKLALERLYQIAAILDSNVYKLLGMEEDIIQEIHESGEIGHRTVLSKQVLQNLSQENKETTQKLILSLTEQIVQLKAEVLFLRGHFNGKANM